LQNNPVVVNDHVQTLNQTFIQQIGDESRASFAPLMLTVSHTLNECHYISSTKLCDNYILITFKNIIARWFCVCDVTNIFYARNNSVINLLSSDDCRYSHFSGTTSKGIKLPALCLCSQNTYMVNNKTPTKH